MSILSSESAGWLMSVYLALVAAGEGVDYFIGRILDQMLPSFSLVVFLCMFFVVILGAWPVAVWLTATKKT
jgi:hypothetical protein